METLMVIALLLSLLNLVLTMTNMKRMKDDEERMNILDDVLDEVREQEAELTHELEMLDKNRVVLAQAHNMLVGRVQTLETQAAQVDPADTAPEVNLFQEWIDRTDEAERRLEAQDPAHE